MFIIYYCYYLQAPEIYLGRGYLFDGVGGGGVHMYYIY